MTSKKLVNLKYRLCNASKSSNAFIASMAHRQISGKIAHDSNPLSQVRTLTLKPSYHLFQTTALKFRRKQTAIVQAKNQNVVSSQFLTLALKT